MSACSLRVRQSPSRQVTREANLLVPWRRIGILMTSNFYSKNSGRDRASVPVARGNGLVSLCQQSKAEGMM
jgi:hypothetical protein